MNLDFSVVVLQVSVERHHIVKHHGDFWFLHNSNSMRSELLH